MPFAVLGTQILDGVDPVDGAIWRIQRDRCSVFSSPSSSIQVQQKTRSIGGWAGDGYLTSKHIVLGGIVRADTVLACEAAIDRLHAACSLSETTLQVNSASSWHHRVRREDEVIVEKLSPSVASWSIQLVATDPRKYGTTLTASTNLPSTSGGLTIPFTIPFTIASAVTSGQVSLMNPGNVSGPVRMRIDGPITGPTVTHTGSGLQLAFATSLSLGVGEFITVDMETRQVLAQGQASRNEWVTNRGWSGFEPGANTWAFSATTGSGILTVTATPAWE